MTDRPRDASDSAGAMQRLLARAIPPADLREQTERVARPGGTVDRRSQTALVFELGGERLALPTPAVARVGLPVTPRRVPHRSSDVLLGIGCAEGELILCASLAALLGLADPERPVDPSRRRSIVVGAEDDRWAFDVDRVIGGLPYDDADERPLPATVAAARARVVRALLRDDDGDVALIDAERLSAALREAL